MLKDEKTSTDFIKETLNETTISDQILVFTDGASNSYHKCSGIGVAFFDNADCKPFHYISKRIHHTKLDVIPTNNEAEYSALIHALEYIIEKDLKNVKVFADSKLVVNQVNGEWQIKCDHLLKLFLTAKELMEKIPEIEIKHIHREKNYFADVYSKMCIGQANKRTIQKFKEIYLYT